MRVGVAGKAVTGFVGRERRVSVSLAQQERTAWQRHRQRRNTAEIGIQSLK